MSDASFIFGSGGKAMYYCMTLCVACLKTHQQEFENLKPPSLIFVIACAGQKYGCDIRTISVDLSDGMSIYPNIAKKLKDLGVGILGQSYQHTLGPTKQHVCVVRA